ncbi:SNF2 family N-terminal domain-domain-containing protein [Syncephalastrum racemosum]|uniref:SNF2 family N-terminal domain-domain-containing protein n=1 Tax=Syncephalastrum racemosum TaxID=13706 RepID=A0A1X2HPR6_SYNRA|nr:SNF2 family N-terminal domain-domain-containing protein [Syncephalastrum racemosum]
MTQPHQQRYLASLNSSPSSAASSSSSFKRAYPSQTMYSDVDCIPSAMSSSSTPMPNLSLIVLSDSGDMSSADESSPVDSDTSSKAPESPKRRRVSQEFNRDRSPRSTPTSFPEEQGRQNAPSSSSRLYHSQSSSSLRLQHPPAFITPLSVQPAYATELDHLRQQHQQHQQQTIQSARPLSQPAHAPEAGDDDEERSTRQLCLGMITTEIVSVKPLNLIRDEQYEPVTVKPDGRQEDGNYSFSIFSRSKPPKFYGWVMYEATRALGPVAERGMAWWDAIIPRGKATPSRTPLLIILYSMPGHKEGIGRLFRMYHQILQAPPLYNPACRYDNPHTVPETRSTSFAGYGSSRKSRSYHGVSTPVSESLTTKPESPDADQTRRDIALLLDSIPQDAKLLKKKRKGNANGETRRSAIVVEDSDEEEDTPKLEIEGLNVNLLPHQVTGIMWMTDREENKTSNGGILADDMGLGKTIQTIGLVLTTLNQAQETPGGERQRTLIVCPLALIRQWAQEFSDKTTDGKLRVLVHHGQTRTRDIEALKSYDVVITTYQILSSDFPKTESRKGRPRASKYDIRVDYTQFSAASGASSPSSRMTSPGISGDENPLVNDDFGPLFQINWYRVVLDEAQQIKNRVTRSAKASYTLNSQKRWCLTGTPLQNSADELYSLIRFLRVQPLCDYPTFRRSISRPLADGDVKIALDRLKAVLMAVMLRRTKQLLHDTQDDAAQDKEPDDPSQQETPRLSKQLSLKLPPRHKKDILLNFTDAERFLYDMISSRTRVVLQKLIQKSKSKEGNYVSMLCMILRLRQACNHPQLVLKALVKDDGGDILGAANNGDTSSPREFNEAAAARDMMANVARGLGWSSASQVSSTGRQTCQLCGRSIRRASTVYESFCDACTQLLQESTEPQTLHTAAIDTKLPPGDFVTSTKVSQVLRILADTRRRAPGEKTIVFSQFTSMLDLLEDPLRKCGFQYVRYDGFMPNSQREKSLRKLREDPACQVMLISLKCGSLGLNLTAANRVILMDVWWNPAVEDQAIDRVHRIGQRLPVEVVRLMIANTMEQKIVELQNQKAMMARGALGDGTVKNTKLTIEEIKSLFDL